MDNGGVKKVVIYSVLVTSKSSETFTQIKMRDPLVYMLIGHLLIISLAYEIPGFEAPGGFLPPFQYCRMKLDELSLIGCEANVNVENIETEAPLSDVSHIVGRGLSLGVNKSFYAKIKFEKLTTFPEILTKIRPATFECEKGTK